MTEPAFLASGAALAVLLRALYVVADAALAGISCERAEELLRQAPSAGRSALARLKRDDDAGAATAKVAAVTLLAIAAALSGALAVALGAPAIPGGLAAALLVA